MTPIPTLQADRPAADLAGSDPYVHLAEDGGFVDCRGVWHDLADGDADAAS